jgi:hypothetical protein
MITDPQTNLSKPRNRALYGVSIAVISYLLIYLGLNAAYANLFALTLMTLSLPILRRLEMAELPF